MLLSKKEKKTSYIEVTILNLKQSINNMLFVVNQMGNYSVGTFCDDQ